MALRIATMTDVEIVHCAPGSLDRGQQVALSDLLDAVADDFVPPLYHRSGTTVSVLDANTARDEKAYFRELLDQDNMLAEVDGTLAAFLSFRNHFTVPALPEVGESMYVSTIAVRPTMRHRGLAEAMYAALFALDGDFPDQVTLRTWSTNTGHIRLITQKLGFTELLRLPDHRGPGIDTVYFGRPRAL